MDLMELMSNEGQMPVSSLDRRLFNACSRGAEIQVEELLSVNANPATLFNGFNCLHIAVKKNHATVVGLLLRASPSLLSSLTSDGRTSLMLASLHGYSELLSLLAGNNDISAVDASGNTALHYAAWGGHMACVTALINDFGASAGIANKDRMLPVQMATAGNHIDVVTFLLQQSSNDCSSSGMNSLHRAAMYGSLDVMRHLVENDIASLSERTNTQNTCLHIASQNNQIAVVEYLLQRNVDINAVNEFHMTALHYACNCGNYEIVKLLLCHGASVSIRSQTGATVLHMSAAAGKHEICRALIDNSPEIDIWSHDETGGNSCIYCYIIHRGLGATPVDMALGSNFKELASKLAHWDFLSLRTEELWTSCKIENALER